MRRTKIVLAVAALLAAMLAAIPGPAAMADTERCSVHDNNFVTCHDDRSFFDGFFFDNCGTEIGGILFTVAPFNDCGFNGFDDGVHNGVFQSVR